MIESKGRGLKQQLYSYLTPLFMPFLAHPPSAVHTVKTGSVTIRWTLFIGRLQDQDRFGNLRLLNWTYFFLRWSLTGE